jgi:hypothetical protein
MRKQGRGSKAWLVVVALAKLQQASDEALDGEFLKGNDSGGMDTKLGKVVGGVIGDLGV